MKKIIVFGAAGGTGRHFVDQAAQAGHKITAVVRVPEAFTFRHANVTVVKGDVFKPSTFEAAMMGQDIVVSCLGIRNTQATTVYSEGVANIMRVMEKAKVDRIICLSAAAVVIPPKASWLMKFLIKNILQKLLKYTYADMLKMEHELSASNLNWTVIRPPRLTTGKLTGNYRAISNGPLDKPSKLSKADLANYIVQHVDDEKTFRAIVGLSY